MTILRIVPAVRVPRPHDGAFSYKSGNALPRGTLVEIPLGKRSVLGIVWGNEDRRRKAARYKDVTTCVAPSPFFPEPTLTFFEWESLATVTPIGVVLNRAIPAWIRSAVRGRDAANLPIHRTKMGERTRARPETPRNAYGDDARRFRTYRLLMRETLAAGKQALVLAPTLAARKTTIAALRHPRCLEAPKGKTRAAKDLWFRVRSGEPLCIVGGMSALRLPFPNLGAVVLDDEANALWKETREHPLTDCRAAAETLAALHGALLVRGGLLPSLETYARLSPNERRRTNNAQTRGCIRIIDLRDDRPRDGLSNSLINEIKDCCKHRRKARLLFFINRRGTAPALSCSDCGFVFTCSDCDAPMPMFSSTAHRNGEFHQNTARNELRCRHCGKTFIPPLVCPSCRGFRIVPRGIADERIAGTLLRIFPNFTVLRLDADTGRTPKREAEILAAFSSAKGPSALVGTVKTLQADLPPVDLIAIPSFDHFLAIPDFRTEEEAFDSVLCLRKFLRPSGFCLIQTWHTESPILDPITRGDFGIFAKRELAIRREFHWPPYRRIAKLTYRHRDPKRAESEAKKLARLLARSLPRSLACELEGPYPAFIPRVRGKYAWRVTIKWKPQERGSTRMATPAKTDDGFGIEKMLWKTVPATWDVDVDPASIL